jgi:hypothetical protein
MNCIVSFLKKRNAQPGKAGTKKVVVMVTMPISMSGYAFF